MSVRSKAVFAFELGLVGGGGRKRSRGKRDVL